MLRVVDGSGRPFWTDETWLPTVFGFIINGFFAVTSQLAFAMLVYERVKDHSYLVEQLTELIEVPNKESPNINTYVEGDPHVAELVSTCAMTKLGSQISLHPCLRTYAKSPRFRGRKSTTLKRAQTAISAADWKKAKSSSKSERSRRRTATGDNDDIDDENGIPGATVVFRASRTAQTFHGFDAITRARQTLSGEEKQNDINDDDGPRLVYNRRESDPDNELDAIGDAFKDDGGGEIGTAALAIELMTNPQETEKKKDKVEEKELEIESVASKLKGISLSPYIDSTNSEHYGKNGRSGRNGRNGFADLRKAGTIYSSSLNPEKQNETQSLGLCCKRMTSGLMCGCCNKWCRKCYACSCRKCEECVKKVECDFCHSNDDDDNNKRISADYNKFGQDDSVIIEEEKELHLADEFVSFDDPENLASWMEMRDHTYIQGMKLFGDLEGIMVTLVLLMSVLALFISADIVFERGLVGETRIARLLIFCISVLWVIEVVLLGIKFDKLQKRQVSAINNQRRCILLTYQDTREVIGRSTWVCLQCITWQKFHEMIRSKYKRGHLKRKTVSNINDGNDDNNNCNGTYTNWTPQEIMYEERRFDQHIKTLRFFTSQLEARPINPQLFGFGLTGTFMRTLIASVVAPFLLFLIRNWSSGDEE